MEKLALPFQRLQSVVVPEPLSLPPAPPEEVPALLAVLFAQPVAVPQPPRGPGAVRRPLPAGPPLAQPLPLWLPGTVVVPQGPRGDAGATPLRVRSHGVPGGAAALAGEIPDALAEPDALPLK